MQLSRMKYLPSVIKARYVRDYIIETTFDDGTKKAIDFAPLLISGHTATTRGVCLEKDIDKVWLSSGYCGRFGFLD